MSESPTLSAAQLFGSGDGADLRVAFERSDITALAGTALGGAAGLSMPLVTELARACTRLVDIDLGRVALQGWVKHRDLHLAAVRTSQAHDTTERVSLAEHLITSEHRPSLEITIGDGPPTTLSVDIVLTLLVHVMDATVRGGALVALEGGAADVSGTLAVQGVMVSSPPSKRIELGRRIDLGQGLPLLAAASANRPDSIRP